MHVDTDKDAYIPSTVVEHGLRSREFVYGRGKPMRIDGVRMSVHGIKLCVGVGATLASCYFAVPAQAQCLTIYSQCFDKTYYGTSVADIAEEWHADQNNLGGDGCNSVPCPFSGAASPSSTLVQVDDQCFVVQSDCTGVNYRYCPESCSECVDAAQCDDGNICNGLESCDLGQCAAGLPMNCDDGRSCTEDSCDPVMGCVNVPDESECCESPVMTNEAERAYSPYEPNYHRYVARTLVGVGWSEERKRDLFLRWRNGPNAAPGIPVNAPDDRPLQLARLPWDDKGENWIYIRTNEELLTWTNITLPGHYFHPGVVINRVETVGPFTYLV